MHKVLFITKRHYTNKDLVLDRFGRLFHLPMQLVQNGYVCMIITANYQSNQVERYNISGLKFLSLPFTIKTSGFFFPRCWQTVKTFKPDIIVASGDTHLGVIGLVYARLTGVPFVFDVYDDYTKFASNKPQIMKALFWMVIHRSDALICSSTPLMKKLYRKNRAVTVIENGVDTLLFKPCSRETARKKLRIDPRDTVIGYFGFIGPDYGVEILVDALGKLRDSYPRAKLLLAGPKNYDIDLSHPYVDHRGAVPQKKIPLFINSANVVVIPYLMNEKINVSNPCKLSEYLACGVPMVSTRVSDISDTLSEIPGAICNPGDVDEMVRALKWQLENQTVATFPESLTWESLGKKFMNVLEMVLHN